MKLHPILVAGALSLALFAGCDSATSSSSSANYAGTGRYTFPVHQSGVVFEAKVTTDASGNVSSTTVNEWQGPGAWINPNATGTYTLVGGEVVRFKMAGKNTSLHLKDAAGVDQTSGYVFFYYNLNSKGWVEFSPTAGAFTPPSSSTAAATPTWDLRLANALYGNAYADACVAVENDPSSTDLTTVTFTTGTAAVVGSGTTANPQTPAVDSVVTVNTNNAAAQVVYTSVGALNKADAASLYFPVKVKSGTTTPNKSANLGWKENISRIVKFFKANPNVDFGSAALVETTWASYTQFAAPSQTYTAFGASSATTATYDSTVDDVWTIGTDGITGATCSDFPAYAQGLQTAYLYALANAKAGISRSVE